MFMKGRIIMYLNKDNQQILLNEIENIFDTLQQDLYRNEFVSVSTIDWIEDSLNIMKKILKPGKK